MLGYGKKVVFFFFLLEGVTGIGGWKRKAGGIGFLKVQLFPAVRIGVETNL